MRFTNFIFFILFFLSSLQLAFARDYRVEIKTRDRGKAIGLGTGTDAKAWIKIGGSKGVTNWVRFNSKKDNLENGNVDKITFSFPDIGVPKTIHFKLTGNSTQGVLTSSPDIWEGEYILVEDLSTGGIYVFDRNIRVRPNVGAIEKSLVPMYQIILKTGDIKYGGSDAKVKIEIVGSEGKLVLNCNKSNYDDRKRGATDVYRIWSQYKPIGSPRTIKILKSRKDGDKNGWNFAGAIITYRGKKKGTGPQNVNIRGGEAKEFSLKSKY